MRIFELAFQYRLRLGIGNEQAHFSLLSPCDIFVACFTTRAATLYSGGAGE